MAFFKKIFDSFAEPFTEILGGKDVFIDQHSALNLTCVVHAPEPPAHIFWIHDGQVSLLYMLEGAIKKFWSFSASLLVGTDIELLDKKSTS